jgi:uncharacterized protein (DUF362 family)
MYPCCCSRRRFLAHSAATVGLMALGTKPLTAYAQLPEGQQADMTIAKWTGAAVGDAKAFRAAAVKLTEQAIEGIGGMKRFVKKGDVIWIKPNIGWDRTPEQAANTNPDVVATIIRLCLDAGAKKIKIGDYTCHAAEKSYKTSGIADAAKALGAEVLFLDESRAKRMAVKGEKVKETPIFPEIIETDLVINIPIAKHHSIATATMCMKNYMGVISDRTSFHQDMPICLADITRFMKPQFCVLDSTRILTAHGPTGGDLADVKTPLTIAAGTDIVALDAFGSELLGHKPEDIPSVVKGAQVGLGKMDYRSLALREKAVS